MKRRSLAALLTLAALSVAFGCSQTAKDRREPAAATSTAPVDDMPAVSSTQDDGANAAKPSTMTTMSAAESPSSKVIDSTATATIPPVSKPKTEPKPIKSPPPTAPKSASEAKRVQFAPHVVIDWSIPRVEIEAEVALSEGLIELLLCGRGTKEHESILVTDASARQIYQAMGLIGLSPGSPVQYDETTQSFLPPRGDRVTIEIEHGDQVIPAQEWMLETKTNTRAGAINWVFAGSRDLAGRFGASGDGTIVCVVNFDTALIAPAALHTSDDAALWLAANDQRVPPVGTGCRVWVRAAADAGAEADAETGPMDLIVTPKGNFHWGDQLLSPIELDQIIRQRIERNPDQRVHLTAIGGTDPRLARVAARCIVGSGIKQNRLTLEMPDEGEGESPSSDSTDE